MRLSSPTLSFFACVFVACTGDTDDTSSDSSPGDSATTVTWEDTGTAPAPEASWSDGILEFQTKTSLGPGSTWTGITADNDQVYVSLKHQNHLWLQVLDHDLALVGERVQLTFPDDVPGGQNLADHKLLKLGDRLFLAWNPNAQNDLYMLAFDLQGNRLGEQVAVETLADTSTADMHLATDGSTLTLIYGPSGLTRRIAELDRDLELLTPPTDIATGGKIDQLGTTLSYEDRWYMFTGDETSQNLTVSYFEADWTPEDPFTDVLIEGSPGEWNWFPSGADRNQDFGIWSVAYHNMPEGGDYENDATLHLAVFDQQLNWAQHFDIGGTDYHASDVTSRGACVFVASAWGDVTIDRYQVKPPDGWEGEAPVCGSGG